MMVVILTPVDGIIRWLPRGFSCSRDGASMREIQIRVLKGLSMLSKGWPGIFAEAAQTLAFETLEHATRADHIDSDRYLIKSIYYNLFSGEDSNKKP